MMKLFVLKLIRIIASGKVINDMKRLYPKWELNRRLYLYYFQKIKTSFLVLLGGAFISILIYFLSPKSELIEGKYIERNGYGKGEKRVELLVNAPNVKDKQYVLNLQERKYSDEEISALSEQCFRTLDKLILAENKSADYVVSNLDFKNKVEGYPFDISYRTDKPLILSQEGNISPEYLSKETENGEGVLIGITILLRYFDFEADETVYVCVYEKSLSEEEIFVKELDSEIEKNELETKGDTKFLLPETVNGTAVYFSQEKDKTGILIFSLFLIVSIIIFFLKDKDLEKEVERRNRELDYEYPRLINKFTLFYNAGMPIKKIWDKICLDYEMDSEANTSNRKSNKKNQNCLYEEMIVTRLQIQDGMREINAYEEFAKRVGLPKYRVFVSLLEQAISMGNKELGLSLKRESEDAFIERKNNAKRLYEEAGTKLLIPMFMMLFVVIIIIMFPAFYSFKM